MFCCLKDKAANLVSLSLENLQVVSDDIVQVGFKLTFNLRHLISNSPLANKSVPVEIFFKKN